MLKHVHHEVKLTLVRRLQRQPLDLADRPYNGMRAASARLSERFRRSLQFLPDAVGAILATTVERLGTLITVAGALGTAALTAEEATVETVVGAAAAATVEEETGGADAGAVG